MHKHGIREMVHQGRQEPTQEAPTYSRQQFASLNAFEASSSWEEGRVCASGWENHFPLKRESIPGWILAAKGLVTGISIRSLHHPSLPQAVEKLLDLSLTTGQPTLRSFARSFLHPYCNCAGVDGNGIARDCPEHFGNTAKLSKSRC